MKKRIVFIIIGYLVTICAVIGIFAFVFSKQLKNNVVECYIATQDIEAGTTWNNVIAETTKKSEATKEYQETLSSNKVVLVTDLKSLNNLKVVKTITKGTVITREYFSVNSATTNKLEEEYDNPKYIPLAVEPNSILSKEVIKGQKMAILANVSLSTLSNLDKEELADENIPKGNVLMSISNNAEVFKIDKDANDNISTITFIMSYDQTVKLLSIKEKAKLYYVDNDSITEGTDVYIKNDLAIIDYNALKQLFASSGYVNSELSEFNSYLEMKTTTTIGDVSNTTYDQIKFKTTHFKYDDVLKERGCSYIEEYDTTKPVYDENGVETQVTVKAKREIAFSYDAPDTLVEVEASNKKVQLKWQSYCPIIYINHYSFDGELNPNGGLGGKYSLSNNDFLYNDKTETYTLKQELDQNGYYEVKFYNKDYELIGKYCFSIEKTKQWATALGENHYVKDYYAKVEPLSDVSGSYYTTTGMDYKATIGVLDVSGDTPVWAKINEVREDTKFDLTRKDGIQIYSLAEKQSLIYRFPYYSACYVKYYDMSGNLFTENYVVNNANGHTLSITDDGTNDRFVEFKTGGYYEITLLENDKETPKTVRFIIETENYGATNSTDGSYATKNYFQAIEPLKNYKISAVSETPEGETLEGETPAEE